VLEGRGQKKNKEKKKRRTYRGKGYVQESLEELEA